jgi:hypothetical protein
LSGPRSKSTTATMIMIFKGLKLNTPPL